MLMSFLDPTVPSLPDSTARKVNLVDFFLPPFFLFGVDFVDYWKGRILVYVKSTTFESLDICRLSCISPNAVFKF